VAIICLIFFNACSKSDFHLPADGSTEDPQLLVTHTIAQLRDRQQAVTITDDVIVSGVVVMNDKSGNYFGKIVIEDKTGGIEICIDQSHLDKWYPVGRKVYIKCKDLILGNDKGNIQLGFGIDAEGRASNIPASVTDKYIVKGPFPEAIPADTVDLAMLADLYTGKPFLGKLVTIRQAEFTSSELGLPYAQVKGIASYTERHLMDCRGNTLTLGTSAYADFQPLAIPAGNGYITGVYERNNSTPRLSIRDTGDVRFYAPRCDGTLPATSGITTIADVRSLCSFPSDSIADLPAYRIAGIVISDRDAGNITPNRLVVQQDDRGLVLSFNDPHAFNLGDSIVADLHHASLSRISGLLQVGHLLTGSVFRAAIGKQIMPRKAHIRDLILHYNDWESTLVQIDDVRINSVSTYGGSRQLTDSSGEMSLFTRSMASFAGNFIPQEVHNITGILSMFNGDVQIWMRNLGDVD